MICASFDLNAAHTSYLSLQKVASESGREPQNNTSTASEVIEMPLSHRSCGVDLEHYTLGMYCQEALPL